MKGVSKSEKRFFGLIAVFVIAIFFILSYTNAIQWVSSQNPFIQFMITNLGIYFIVFFIFKAIALKKKQSFKGILGVVLGFIAIDILLPEYHITKAGELIQGGIFGAGSSDYVIGYVGQMLGITGIYLGLFTYLFVELVILFIAIKLEKDFVRGL